MYLWKCLKIYQLNIIKDDIIQRYQNISKKRGKSGNIVVKVREISLKKKSKSFLSIQKILWNGKKGFTIIIVWNSDLESSFIEEYKEKLEPYKKMDKIFKTFMTLELKRSNFINIKGLFWYIYIYIYIYTYINKVVVFNMFSLGKQDFKYFIGYIDNKRN